MFWTLVLNARTVCRAGTTLVVNREAHAHTGDQLRFPAETVIPSHLLYICPVLMLKCQPFLFHLQGWVASVLVSPLSIFC